MSYFFFDNETSDSLLHHRNHKKIVTNTSWEILLTVVVPYVKEMCHVIVILIEFRFAKMML